jgi:hypothetical protein
MEELSGLLPGGVDRSTQAKITRLTLISVLSSGGKSELDFGFNCSFN